MLRRFMLFLAVAALACVSDPAPTGPGSSPPPPPPPTIEGARITGIDISFLPSPYYRFEYDSAGKVTVASFASDLRTYEVQYSGNRITKVVSTRFSREELTYFYDAAGNISTVTYTDAAGVVYVRIHLTYLGERLVSLERERRFGTDFLFDKVLTFVYDSRGNLAQLTDERLQVPGQDGSVFVDSFEQYDEGINVDGFSLIHSEFFDHLVLLPGVRFQVGNPASVTRSGSGINYHINYSYTYDSSKRPTSKHGEGTLLNGTDVGQTFFTNATFSY